MSLLQSLHAGHRTCDQREGYVFGPAVPLYYKIIGEGAPLLFLHGGPGCTHSGFLPFVLEQARRRQLIFIDERGSGRSGRLEDPRHYTLDNMVEDVEAVRLALGLKQFALLGHSFGGILAQAYAIKYGGALTHLILASTAGSARLINADFKRIYNALPAKMRASIAAHEKRGIYGANGAYHPAYAKVCEAALLPFNFVRARERAKDRDEPIAWPVLREMWVRKSDFRIDGNLRGFDFSDALQGLRVPTLIMAGDHDLVSSKSAQALQASIPGSQLTVLPECGHMLYVDQTALFNSVVSQFLDHSPPAPLAARSGQGI
jgi:proline-specific peptidase